MIYWLKTGSDIEDGNPDVVAYYSFNGAISSVITDDSGHGNDAEPVGAVSSTSTSKRGNGARMLVNTSIDFPDVVIGTNFEINFFARR